MNTRILLYVCALLLYGCGDLLDTEIHSGDHTVYYHESDNTEAQAKALLAYMDSTKTPFTVARILPSNGATDSTMKGVSVFIEGEFKNAKDNDQQRFFAARMARRLSEEVFDSIFCSVSLVSSVDAASGRGNLSGRSNDPRLP